MATSSVRSAMLPFGNDPHSSRPRTRSSSRPATDAAITPPREWPPTTHRSTSGLASITACGAVRVEEGDVVRLLDDDDRVPGLGQRQQVRHVGPWVDQGAGVEDEAGGAGLTGRLQPDAGRRLADGDARRPAMASTAVLDAGGAGGTAAPRSGPARPRTATPLTSTTLQRGARGALERARLLLVSRLNAAMPTDTTATRRRVMKYAGCEAVIGSHRETRMATLTTRVTTESARGHQRGGRRRCIVVPPSRSSGGRPGRHDLRIVGTAARR